MITHCPWDSLGYGLKRAKTLTFCYSTFFLIDVDGLRLEKEKSLKTEPNLFEALILKGSHSYLSKCPFKRSLKQEMFI
jgi:hypothetical protein